MLFNERQMTKNVLGNFVTSPIVRDLMGRAGSVECASPLAGVQRGEATPLERNRAPANYASLKRSSVLGKSPSSERDCAGARSRFVHLRTAENLTGVRKFYAFPSLTPSRN